MHVEGTVLRGRVFDPVEGRVVIEDGDRLRNAVRHDILG